MSPSWTLFWASIIVHTVIWGGSCVSGGILLGTLGGIALRRRQTRIVGSSRPRQHRMKRFAMHFEPPVEHFDVVDEDVIVAEPM